MSNLQYNEWMYQQSLNSTLNDNYKNSRNLSKSIYDLDQYKTVVKIDIKDDKGYLQNKIDDIQGKNLKNEFNIDNSNINNNIKVVKDNSIYGNIENKLNVVKDVGNDAIGVFDKIMSKLGDLLSITTDDIKKYGLYIFLLLIIYKKI